MSLQPWVLGAFAVLVAVHLLVVFCVHRRRTGEFSWAESTGPDESVDDPSAGAVECQECGAENEPEYRYCRRCVAELPGGIRGGADGASPQSRGLP